MLIEIDKDISSEEALKIAEKELEDGEDKDEVIKKLKEKEDGKSRVTKV